jgi:protein-S-isoprenylcysteine O-methyltransferase Ste14
MSKDAPEVAERKESPLTVVMWGLFIGQVILCIVAFNYADLDVIMYLGWVTLVAAFLLGWMAQRTFVEKGGAKGEERWVETHNLVDTGIYAAIRHPIYLCMMLIAISFMMISQHWLSILLGVPILVYLYFGAMIAEEKINLEKFGDPYRDYMRRVPRMNIVLGIIRLMRKKTGTISTSSQD